MKRCAVYEAGLTDYARGLAIQEAAKVLVAGGAWDGILILLEHKPVITLGRAGGRENLLTDYAILAAAGIEVVDTDRGGNVTCHNPGQIVGYPVLNLSCWRPDVHWYTWMLEETLIRTLAGFYLTGARREGQRGVWLGEEKIASIGVNVRNWITSHGFSLNVANDLDLFRRIRPCGIDGAGVTSFWSHERRIEPTLVAGRFRAEFAERFDCVLQPLENLEGPEVRPVNPGFREELIHGVC